MNIFIFLMIIGLIFLILTKKKNYYGLTSFGISFLLFIRLVLSFVFLIDPNENYVKTMRFEYFEAVIDNPEPDYNMKRYLSTWRKMYDDEIV